MKEKINKSFYDWCIENNRYNLLDIWDYETNQCNPKDVYYKSGKVFHFQCSNNKNHIGRYIPLNNIILQNTSEFRCSECNSFYNWCIQNNKEDILQMWDYKLNQISIKDVSKSDNRKFWFIVNNESKIISQQFAISYIVKTNKTPFYHKTFYQWCIENNRSNYLKRWDYKINNISPEDITYGSTTKVFLKCPNNQHESASYSIAKLIQSNAEVKCMACNSFAQWGINNIGRNFLEQYWDYEKNIVSPYKISKGSSKKVWLRCQEKDYHGSYDVQCYSFVEGKRCSMCHPLKDKNIHKYDSLGYLYPEVFEIWSDKNKKSPYMYLPCSGKKVWWKCADGLHDDYLRQINVALNQRDFRCAVCSKIRNESILQEKVRKFIEENYNFTLKHEYDCSLSPINPNTNCRLLYDNEIVELKLIIEVNGQQHYNINGLAYLTAKTRKKSINQVFKDQQWRDSFKEDYALSKGYNYLIIPYWTDNKTEKWKSLIEDKINELRKIN